MLELEHIYKRFNAGTIDEKILFDDFNLSIDRGDFVAIVGSNGSGKTTALNIVSGDVKPDKGRVILEGADITKQKNYQRAAKIARVFQNPSMGTSPSMTIMENMSIADNKGQRYGLGKGLNNKRKDFYRSQLELLGMGLENR
ncbi:MAG: ATP-binding cassette domain-containing protein, partial [Clostridiales bacterium]|nr:ATP-binding cassette domain-containing protein [Clostridiales bacterium]